MATKRASCCPYITMEILSRLPAKALVRFSVICKAWYSLVRNPNFVTMHFNNSNCYGNSSRNCKPSAFRLPDLVFRDDNFCYRERVRRYMWFFIDSYCNGLILRTCGPDRKLYVYNPSIRKLKFICTGHRNWQHDALGFGFDKFSLDYKVVRLLSGRNGNLVEVFSLKADCWRSIEIVGWPDFRSYCSVTCNGAVHWWSMCRGDDRQNAVISFDLSLEVFGEIALPVEVVSKHGVVILFNGLLSLFVDNSPGGRHDHGRLDYEIWVMKEYGVVESWTKEITGAVEGICTFNRDCPVFGSTNGGKLIFQKSKDIYGMLALWDPKNQLLENLGHPAYTHAVVDCMENLALLEGGDRFGAHTSNFF